MARRTVSVRAGATLQSMAAPDPRQDTTRKKGTKRDTPEARDLQKKQARAAVNAKRVLKSAKRREHLTTHRDPVAYGREHVPVSPILLLTFERVDELKLLDFTVISGDRRAGVAEKFGHDSQTYLWEHQNDPGFNPANPPGTSPHEYKNGGPSKLMPGFVGGPAYPRMKVGAELDPHELGIDMGSNAEASAFCAAVESHGLHFFQPYDTGSELHHVQCRMKAEALITWLVHQHVIA